MSHYVLSLKLKTDKNDIRFLNDVFFHANHIHNQLVSHCRKQLKKLRRDKIYRRALKTYIKLKEDKTEVFRQAADVLNERIRYYGLTKYDMESYIKTSRYQRASYIGADVAQKQVAEVYQAVKKVLYGNGKIIHYRKLEDMTSIEGKKTTANITMKYDMVIIGQKNRKHQIGVQFPKHSDTKERAYFKQAYRPDDIAYYRIKRKMFRGGWQYYLEMVIKGVPPEKHKVAEQGRAGIDNGTSTTAIVTEDMIILEDLDKGVKKVADRIAEIQRRMDQSRRHTNPKNYKEDGTIRKGRKIWNFSGHYHQIRRELKTIYRKRAEALKQHHEQLANTVLEHACVVYTEEADTTALAKRSKKTKLRKDGKIGKKKRFGKSVGTYAPAQLIQIIDRKLGYQERAVQKVNTKTFKASQYNHIKDEYKKKELSARSFFLDDTIQVQRDLYSAFLLSCSSDDLQQVDRELCNSRFPAFLDLHDRQIQYMMEHSDEYKNPCFGLKDFK